MSVPLHTYGKAWSRFAGSPVGRVTRTAVPSETRADHILVRDGEPAGDDDWAGYAGVITTADLDAQLNGWKPPEGTVIVHRAAYLDHVGDGDVVALNPSGYVRTLYRVSSPHNALLATERCNSYCLMCSQPPRQTDDRARVREHLRVIELMNPATRELGITGGEPTLLGQDLLRIVARCKERLPETALHILSNGRLFYYGPFARDLAAIGHPNLMVGIPLYADVDFLHDHVVQAAGAFDETMIGLQNLGRYGVHVEVRVVIHRHTYRRLEQLSEFIYRNLAFAQHVALMGLEIMGFAIPNLNELWVDPYDYRIELQNATRLLANRGITVSIYNHQLCVLPTGLWPFARKSISDWKNEYLPACDDCCEKAACGGFFASSPRRRYSTHIAPLG